MAGRIFQASQRRECSFSGVLIDFKVASQFFSEANKTDSDLAQPSAVARLNVDQFADEARLGANTATLSLFASLKNCEATLKSIRTPEK